MMMKCSYCESENTKLSGGCYCCYDCLDCNKGFRLGIRLVKIIPAPEESWKKFGNASDKIIKSTEIFPASDLINMKNISDEILSDEIIKPKEI